MRGDLHPSWYSRCVIPWCHSILHLGKRTCTAYRRNRSNSVVLGIASAARNTRAYYWLMLQIMFAVFGSIASIPIAFTAYSGGFFAGVFLTQLFVEIERKKRAKYSRPSGNNTYDTWRGE